MAGAMWALSVITVIDLHAQPRRFPQWGTTTTHDDDEGTSTVSDDSTTESDSKGTSVNGFGSVVTGQQPPPSAR
jgi:hypothetical protein